jgi:hypothetical protein
MLTTQNIPLNGVIMSCNDTLLADAFNNIAVAISNMGSQTSQGQCCGTIQNVVNNSLQGFVPALGDGSPIPVYGSVPPLSLPVSGIPDGFETIEEYQVNKCALAHQTIDGVAATLRGLGAITVFNIITLGGLVLVALASSIAFPPAAIPALLAAMLLLTGGLAVLVTMGDLITEHRDELICVLYESDTVELMIQGVEAIMVTLVALLPVSGALALVVKSITMMFFNTDTLNGLMSNVAALGYPDADCSMCGCARLQIDLTSGSFGYALEALDCGGGTPSTSGASVSWSVGGLEMSAPNTGSTNAANAAGDPVSATPEVGDILRLTGKRTVNTNNFVRIDAIVDGQCVALGSGGFTALASTAIEFSVDAFAGQEITGVNLYVNNSISQAFGVVIEDIYIGCP